MLATGDEHNAIGPVSPDIPGPSGRRATFSLRKAESAILVVGHLVVPTLMVSLPVIAALPLGPSGSLDRLCEVLGLRVGTASPMIGQSAVGRCSTDLVKGSAVARLSDESLLQAHLDGDRAALPDLIRRYHLELLHFLTRFLGSRAAAEDVFQETFLQIHLSAESFDPARRFKPWLFTIAANKGRDYHRKHSRPTVSLSAHLGNDGGGRQFVDLLEAGLPSPEAPILDAERSRLVKQVIDAMPDHLREILLLSYFQKMSYNQIADALEIPLGTVKSRLHAAVATFARGWAVAQSQEGKRS